MNNVLVVSNLNAGRRKAIKYRKAVQKFLLANALDFKFVSADELVTLSNFEFDTVIVMGGDGTINKILPFLDNKVLGIIPCGTANLLAAKLGIPDNIDKALRIIRQNHVAKVDLMDVNGRPCVLRCGIGFDSNIICHTPQKLKNKFGYLAYFVAGALFSLRLKKKNYSLSFDNNNVLVNASCIIIANSDNMFRRFFNIGINSKLNDQKFEVFVLQTENPFLFYFELLRIFFNVKQNSSRALYLQAMNVCLQSNYFNFHIDGENIKENNNICVQYSGKQIGVIAKCINT